MVIIDYLGLGWSGCKLCKLLHSAWQTKEAGASVDLGTGVPHCLILVAGIAQSGI